MCDDAVSIFTVSVHMHRLLACYIGVIVRKKNLFEVETAETYKRGSQAWQGKTDDIRRRTIIVQIHE